MPAVVTTDDHHLVLGYDGLEIGPEALSEVSCGNGEAKVPGSVFHTLSRTLTEGNGAARGCGERIGCSVFGVPRCSIGKQKTWPLLVPSCV